MDAGPDTFGIRPRHPVGGASSDDNSLCAHGHHHRCRFPLLRVAEPGLSQIPGWCLLRELRCLVLSLSCRGFSADLGHQFRADTCGERLPLRHPPYPVPVVPLFRVRQDAAGFKPMTNSWLLALRRLSGVASMSQRAADGTKPFALTQKPASPAVELIAHLCLDDGTGLCFCDREVPAPR